MRGGFRQFVFEKSVFLKHPNIYIIVFLLLYLLAICPSFHFTIQVLESLSKLISQSLETSLILNYESIKENIASVMNHLV